jgi:hypothetical protein
MVAVGVLDKLFALAVYADGVKVAVKYDFVKRYSPLWYIYHKGER